MGRKAQRKDTRGMRPHRDGRKEPARRIEHTGRRVPPQTGVAPVVRSGVPTRRFDVAGPVATYDPPTAIHGTLPAVAPDGTVRKRRGVWLPDADPRHAPDGTNPYGRGRTPTVGNTAAARKERRLRSARAASRIDAIRAAARRKDAADAAQERRSGPRARPAGRKRRR